MGHVSKKVMVGLAVAGTVCLLWYARTRQDGTERGLGGAMASPVNRILDGKSVLGLPENMTTRALAFLRKGKLLAVTASVNQWWPGSLEKNADVVQVWDIEGRSLIREWKKGPHAYRHVAIDPEGATIAISSDGELVRWNVLDGRELWSYGMPAGGRAGATRAAHRARPRGRNCGGPG